MSNLFIYLFICLYIFFVCNFFLFILIIKILTEKYTYTLLYQGYRSLFLNSATKKKQIQTLIKSLLFLKSIVSRIRINIEIYMSPTIFYFPKMHHRNLNYIHRHLWRGGFSRIIVAITSNLIKIYHIFNGK